MDLILTLLMIGIFVGFITTIVGLGGGILIVPALCLYLGFPHHDAVATSLLTISFVTGFNVFRFHIQKDIQWNTIFLLISIGAVASFSGGKMANYFQAQVLLFLFILLLLFLIIKTLFIRDTEVQSADNSSFTAANIKIGTLSGIISGLSGVGGGSILTPLLMSRKDIDRVNVIPTSNAFMLVTSISAAIAYASESVTNTVPWQTGLVHWDAAFFIFLGAVPSSWVGTKIQGAVPLKFRKILLAGFLIIIFLRMSIRLFTQIWA